MGSRPQLYETSAGIGKSENTNNNAQLMHCAGDVPYGWRVCALIKNEVKLANKKAIITLQEGRDVRRRKTSGNSVCMQTAAVAGTMALQSV